MLTFQYICLAVGLVALVFWVLLVASYLSGIRTGFYYFYCNSCSERFYGTRLMVGGTVEEMRRTGWLVLRGNVHYCPCCSKLVTDELKCCTSVGPAILPPYRASDNPYAV